MAEFTVGAIFQAMNEQVELTSLWVATTADLLFCSVSSRTSLMPKHIWPDIWRLLELGTPPWRRRSAFYSYCIHERRLLTPSKLKWEDPFKVVVASRMTIRLFTVMKPVKSGAFAKILWWQPLLPRWLPAKVRKIIMLVYYEYIHPWLYLLQNLNRFSNLDPSFLRG